MEELLGMVGPGAKEAISIEMDGMNSSTLLPLFSPISFSLCHCQLCQEILLVGPNEGRIRAGVFQIE